MNIYQVKGAVKDIAGRLQEDFERLVCGNEQQAQGLSKQLAGKVEKVYGEVKESVQDATGARA